METRTLDKSEYEFRPESGEIVIYASLSDQAKLLLINNLEPTVVPIYSFGCSGLSGELNGKVLTFEADVSAMSSNDKLVVVIEDRDLNKEICLLLQKNNRLLEEQLTESKITNQYLSVMSDEDITERDLKNK